MIPVPNLSADVDQLLKTGLTPADTLHQLVQLVGTALEADRCFLYVRQPDQKRGRTAFCWRRNEQIPDDIQPDWQPDTGALPDQDPLIGPGWPCAPRSTSMMWRRPGLGVLNRDFERDTFGHRALIHAHIERDGQLWGILQPCLFGKPATGPRQRKTR